MTVSASKVSSLCTISEIQLVRASRRPELYQLTHSQLKRFTIRARKLADKWQDQSRGQARKLSRQFGSGLAATNARLKAQVFSEALKSFAARLAHLEPVSPAPNMSKPKTKKVRNAGHRATRAKVRKALAAH